MFANSPKLFAANHVLRRLLPPRHPPFALTSLTINLTPVARPPEGARAADRAGHLTSLRHATCIAVAHSSPINFNEIDRLDSERYSIIKDRRMTWTASGLTRLPACFELAAREGHLHSFISVSCAHLLRTMNPMGASCEFWEPLRFGEIGRSGKWSRRRIWWS